VPSGASSKAWAILGGILVIHAGFPAAAASILPYVAAETAGGVGDVERPPFVGASGLVDMLVVVFGLARPQRRNRLNIIYGNLGLCGAIRQSRGIGLYHSPVGRVLAFARCVGDYDYGDWNGGDQYS